MTCCIIVFFDLSPIDWNALTAIGTLLLALITFITVLQNKAQLKEMKRQWEEEQSADLDISLINIPYRMPNESLAIEIKNFGKGAANDIQLFLDKNFIENFPHKAVREQADKIEKMRYRILPEESKIIPLCQFDNNYVKCDKLFGQNVSKEEKNKIHKYLDNYTFHLKCEYKGNNSPFEHTFTTEEKGWVRGNIASKLDSIDCKLEDIETINQSLNSISLEVNSIYTSIIDFQRE